MHTWLLLLMFGLPAAAVVIAVCLMARGAARRGRRYEREGPDPMAWAGGGGIWVSGIGWARHKTRTERRELLEGHHSNASPHKPHRKGHP